MNDKSRLSAREWQLLSAYLDDQLSEKEKQQVEQLLKIRTECLAALEDLKRLRVMLRQLPMRQVPRNFTISASAAVRQRVPTFNRMMRFASVATAALLGLVFALDYLPALRPLTVGEPRSEMLAVEPTAAPAAEMAQKSAPEKPQIIFWGGPPAMGSNTIDRGGGAGMGGGMTAPEMTIPEARVIPQDELSESDVLMLPEVQEPLSELDTTSQSAKEKTPQPPEPMPIQGEALVGSAPILGVRPPEERGRMEIPAGQYVQVPSVPGRRLLRTAQIALLSVLILTSIPAWLVRQR